MRDLVITLIGAVISIVVLIGVMSPQQQPVHLSKPSTEDAGKHGLKALHTWLQQNNVPVYSLRRPVTRIEQDELPVTGNLMIIHLPYARDVLESEWQALNHWVSRGNTVLALASMYHKPEWSGSGFDEEAIEKITGQEFYLSREAIEGASTDFNFEDVQRSVDLFKPEQIELHSAIKHLLFENSDNLLSWHTPGTYQSFDEMDELHASYWYISSESSRLAMELMHANSAEQVAMWLLPVGQGWLYLSAFSDLLGNNVLKEKDNARWFANLVSITTQRGGVVIFDDYHFGLSDLYDPEAFFTDDRLYNTFLFIGAFWLLYALGKSPRLAPVRRQVIRPATRDFVEAMAGFFTRRLKPAVIAREIALRTIDQISYRTQLSDEALWDWLNDHPDVSQHDRLLLQRASGYTKGRVKLFNLTRSINRIYKVLR